MKTPGANIRDICCVKMRSLGRIFMSFTCTAFSGLSRVLTFNPTHYHDDVDVLTC